MFPPPLTRARKVKLAQIKLICVLFSLSLSTRMLIQREWPNDDGLL